MVADLEGAVGGWTEEEQQEHQPLLMMIELEKKDVVMMETVSLDMMGLARLQQCFDEEISEATVALHEDREGEN